jgi:hypothetical protein
VEIEVIPTAIAFMNTKNNTTTINKKPLTDTVSNAAHHIRLAARKTRPLPDIAALKALNPYASKKGMFYVTTPQEGCRIPFREHEVQVVRTLEEARALAEDLSRRAGISQKWHQIISVGGSPERLGSFQLLIAEHRIGYGWMTTLIGSECEPYLDWENIDPRTAEWQMLEMARAAADEEAKDSVQCPQCGALVSPPSQR